MVTNQLDAFLFLRQYERLVGVSCVHQWKPDTDEAFQNEVKLGNLLVLVIDDPVVLCGSKVSGQETIGYVAEELFVLNWLVFKEPVESFEQIFE